MVQIHKEFTDSQVKELIERYSKREVKIHYVLEILGIKRSRFFVLLKQYKECSNKFSIQYGRKAKTRKISQSIEHNIIKAKIREATKEDLNTLKNVYNRAWLTSNTPFRPISKSDLQKILDYEDTVFLIAKVYGFDAAFLLLDFEGENKEIAVIAALAVIPRFQRKGVGSILGMASWRYLKEHFPNVKEIRCEVYKDNKISYAFIKGIGFEEFDRKVYKKEDFEIEEK